MNRIDIQITKAEIESFSVSFQNGEPQVAATIGLYTENGKKVSTFNISTATWASVKFELPLGMIEPILQISKQLEAIVTLECNKQLSLIE